MSTARQPKSKPEMVTLRNMCAHPLVFRVPGRDVRIGPHATTEIERGFLNTSALQRLSRNRHVLVIEDVARAAPEPAVTPPHHSDHDEHEQRPGRHRPR